MVNLVAGEFIDVNVAHEEGAQLLEAGMSLPRTWIIAYCIYMLVGQVRTGGCQVEGA